MDADVGSGLCCRCAVDTFQFERAPSGSVTRCDLVNFLLYNRSRSTHAIKPGGGRALFIEATDWRELQGWSHRPPPQYYESSQSLNLPALVGAPCFLHGGWLYSVLTARCQLFELCKRFLVPRPYMVPVLSALSTYYDLLWMYLHVQYTERS